MALFFRKNDETRPRRGWPWRLTVGDAPPSQTFSWADLRRALEALSPHTDSFVILEQRDPKDARRYWYLQSALVQEGGQRGRYVVGCGFSRESGRPAMLERYTSDLGEVLHDFDLARQYKGPDLSYYVDCSNQLPNNAKK